MQKTIDETNRRREKQLAYNAAHGITPQQIMKSHTIALPGCEDTAGNTANEKPQVEALVADPVTSYMTRPQLEKSIAHTRKLMQEAAKQLNFIEAAQYRDELLRLEELIKTKNHNP